MARRGSTGVIKAWFVPTVVNISAPTVAEITAGTDLTGHLTRDGLATPSSGSTTDVSDASSRQNKRAAGSFGGDDWTVTLYRDDVAGNDTAWALLVRDLAGFIVIRRFGGSDVAVAAAQKVEVAPIVVISRQMANIADNTSVTFTANLAITDEYDDAGVVAA